MAPETFLYFVKVLLYYSYISCSSIPILFLYFVIKYSYIFTSEFLYTLHKSGWAHGGGGHTEEGGTRRRGAHGGAHQNSDSKRSG